MPFVLSIGIGFSKAVNASEGFGMLTIMRCVHVGVVVVGGGVAAMALFLCVCV